MVKLLIKNIFFITLLYGFSISSAYAEVKGENSDVDAAVAIANTYCYVFGLMSGNYGVLIGLFIALFGFYKFIMSGSLKGILIVIVGALVPAFPSVMASNAMFLASVFEHDGSRATHVKTLNEACRSGHVFTAPENSTPDPIDVEYYEKKSRKLRNHSFQAYTGAEGYLTIDIR